MTEKDNSSPDDTIGAFQIDLNASEEDRVLAIIDGVMKMVSDLINTADVSGCTVMNSLVGAMLGNLKQNDHAGCAARTCLGFLMNSGVGRVVSFGDEAIRERIVDPDSSADIIPLPTRKPTEHWHAMAETTPITEEQQAVLDLVNMTLETVWTGCKDEKLNPRVVAQTLLFTLAVTMKANGGQLDVLNAIATAMSPEADNYTSTVPMSDMVKHKGN